MQWDLISERVSSKLGDENGSKSFLDAQRQKIIVLSLKYRKDYCYLIF